MRHCIPAMRSLIVLMALRATGISAKRRKLRGVGLGMTPARTSVDAPGVKMVGRGTVLRADEALVACSAAGAGRRTGQCWWRDAEPAQRAPAMGRTAPRKAVG